MGERKNCGCAAGTLAHHVAERSGMSVSWIQEHFDMEMLVEQARYLAEAGTVYLCLGSGGHQAASGMQAKLMELGKIVYPLAADYVQQCAIRQACSNELVVYMGDRRRGVPVELQQTAADSGVALFCLSRCLRSKDCSGEASAQFSEQLLHTVLCLSVEYVWGRLSAKKEALQQG
ncbi:hypothetical protein [Ectobacillus ponti]|uniref:SIS domain-containing protein n=1 Tax=Ectobacillus ponti TaxID=2961894 RepID=A0AA41X414_9BACI|nr:hypothetical protein [Ectobacillus ponti]MCP8968564.1 hypothetical protein [Ectobacillus ponti]